MLKGSKAYPFQKRRKKSPDHLIVTQRHIRFMKRVVVLRSDHLGDMLLTTPLVRTLHQGGFEVTVVGKRAWSLVWQGNPHAAYCALEENCPDWPHSIFALTQWLRKQKFSHLLIPHHDPKLFRASLFSGIPHRTCQFGRWWGRLTLHQCLSAGFQKGRRHFGEIWQDYSRELGITPGSPRPELFLSAEENEAVRKKLEEHLSGNQPLICLHPFSQGSACNLPLSVYAEICESLRQEGFRVVVTGLAADLESWRKVAPAPDATGVWVACGQLSLRELFAVIGQARMVIVGSTGPLHVASALNIPSITPFCPDPFLGPDLWRNLAEQSIHLVGQKEECHQLHCLPRSTCPGIKGFQSSDILRAAHSILNGS